MRTKFFAISLIAFLALFPSPALAHEEDAAEHQDSTEIDLGISSPGILPTNPFYFFKEWARTIRRVFTVDPVAKANYELKVVNEKAAELQELKELGADETALLKAIANYEEDMNRLKSRLETLEETSENPEVDELIDRLTQRVVEHQELFNSLVAEHENLENSVIKTQGNLDEIVISIVEKIDTPEKFGKRVLEKIKGEIDTPEEAMWSDLLIRVAEEVESEEVRAKLGEAKTELLERFGDFGDEEEVEFGEVKPGGIKPQVPFELPKEEILLIE